MIEIPESQPPTFTRVAGGVTSFRLREDGVDIVPTVANYTLWDRDGITVLHTEVPASASPLVATVPPASIATAAYGGRYVELWEYDGVPYTREAYIGLVQPASPITDEDLERTMSGILSEAPDGSDPNIPADPTWAGKRLQAWKRLQAKLLQYSIDITVIVSWYGFLDYLTYDTLALICADLATDEAGSGGSGRWTALATQNRTDRDAEWLRLGYSVDRTRDLIPDDDGPSQVSGNGHLGTPGLSRRW